MIELPLFPLNTVLFPGTPLSLHVFEERYRLMIQRCLDEKAPFGVVLIKRGDEALGPLAEPHAVGCTARISRVQPLGDGRMNLVAVGDERFRILDLDRERPYLVARAELVPHDPDGDGDEPPPGMRRLRRLVADYLRELARAGDAQIEAMPLPEEPLALAYLAAFVLQVPARRKQPLLAADSATELLRELGTLYQREVPLLRTMVEHRDQRQDGPFSLN